MAYNAQHLSVLAYANGFTLWHYRSPDPCAEIRSADYFTDAQDMLCPRDLIIFSGKDGDGFVFFASPEVPK